jgi:hypothetical protein
MDFERTYNLFGVRIHLATDSLRIQEEAGLFLGAHQVSEEGIPDFRLVFEEADTLPDFGQPGLRACEGQEHQILDSGGRMFFSVAEGVACYDRLQRVGQGFVHPSVNGGCRPFGSVPLIHLFVIRIMFAADFLPLHASAVLCRERLLLLSGEKGAGKSTLALRFHWRGFPLICDDLLYLTKQGNRLMAGGHCQPIKLKTAEAEPLLLSHKVAPGQVGVAGKLLFPTEQFNPDGVNRLYPVEAVVWLQNAATRGEVAAVWPDREPEVLYHLLGDLPMLNTPAYRAGVLDLLSSAQGCRLLLVQTSPHADQTVQAILQAVA